MLPWQPIKLRNSDKSLMKCGELFNKHFCKNKILLTPMRQLKFPSMPSFSFILLTVSEKYFEYFFENLPFMSPRQPIKSSDLDKSRMKHGGLLNKHFYKKKSNIPNDLAEIFNFHFSHYKSIETLSCHSNQSSYPTKLKKHNFCRG